MFKKAKLFFLVAETPLHPGSGGDSTGFVDLPIQRERYTNFPKIEASSLKGSIREAFSVANKEIQINGQKIRPLDKADKDDYLSLVFGPENSDESYASAISFLDARILLFPVKSLKGIFAWITSPMVLERFVEDLKFLEFKEDNLKNHGFLNNLDQLKNTVPTNSDLVINNNVVVLEEYTFKVNTNENTSKIASFIAKHIFKENEYTFWQEKLQKSLIILPDDEFRDFVTNSTEIITRTKIDDRTGTVQQGALWTEEYLPQETILYSIAFSSPLRVENENKKGALAGKTIDDESENVIKFFEGGLPKIIQIGGNQSLGKGIIRVQMLD